KTICPQRVNQVCKKQCGEQEQGHEWPAARAEQARQPLADSACGQQNLSGEQQGEDGQRDGKSATTVAEPSTIEGRGQGQHGRETKGRGQAQLAFAHQGLV